MAAGRILSFDIGGTGLKAALLDPKGNLIGEHVRVLTPHPCPPALLVKTLKELVAPLKGYARSSVGFPGVVRGGKVITAPNLGTEDFAGFDLAGKLSKALGGIPVRLINDADMQGFAVVKGVGLEMVVTLGTGFGSALFRDGELMPHLEVAHMLAHKSKTFDEYIGDKERKKIGNKDWNKRVEEVLPFVFTLVHYDRLYISGGNAKHLTIDLPKTARIVPNISGIKGGAGLWKQKVWK
ncbi:polyphosphate glucokinase [Rhizomicrobium palustre]|uniref:Polyphosphate glucokinase n=1 Tax=Rhizomicrobium palustre TaxID=189966 RepID=A0A846N196_9PROT|nr:ROK family protein [Rhizomicrobium palustre]NIK89259.1 polyphosphate glucokinase [Rhizomicrobium palustre]